MKKAVRDRLVTDSLGFRLEIRFEVHSSKGGKHVTYEDTLGQVEKDAIHRICVNPKLSDEDLIDIIAHEVYHLFYSIRGFITVDEEMEAICFGQLVKHAHAFFKSVK